MAYNIRRRGAPPHALTCCGYCRSSSTAAPFAHPVLCRAVFQTAPPRLIHSVHPSYDDDVPNIQQTSVPRYDVPKGMIHPSCPIHPNTARTRAARGSDNERPGAHVWSQRVIISRGARWGSGQNRHIWWRSRSHENRTARTVVGAMGCRPAPAHCAPFHSLDSLPSLTLFDERVEPSTSQ